MLRYNLKDKYILTGFNLEDGSLTSSAKFDIGATMSLISEYNLRHLAKGKTIKVYKIPITAVSCFDFVRGNYIARLKLNLIDSYGTKFEIRDVFFFIAKDCPTLIGFDVFMAFKQIYREGNIVTLSDFDDVWRKDFIYHHPLHKNVLEFLNTFGSTEVQL